MQVLFEKRVLLHYSCFYVEITLELKLHSICNTILGFLMTIDVNVKQLDSEFLEDIDEIIEDTMVQIFVVHPSIPEEIELVQSEAMQHNSIFYTVPYRLKETASQKCIGYKVVADDIIDTEHFKDKVVFIDATDLTPKMITKLHDSSIKGIILNPTSEHTELEHFLLSFGVDTFDHFDTQKLSEFSMDRLVLQSGYPDNNFETLHETAKKISDVMFRPEHSIIARATKSALELFGLR